MAEKTKAQLIQILTEIINRRGYVPISNVVIEDGGATYKLVSLTIYEGEIGASLADWFYPLNELTKKELTAIYKDVR